MPQRLPFSMSLAVIGLALVGLSGSLISGAAHADTSEVQPRVGFSYETGHLTRIDINLGQPQAAPALLSLYSKGPSGLRLLQNGFTDAHGRYQHELQVPAHLDEVVVVVRSAERQDRLELKITNQLIAYAE